MENIQRTLLLFTVIVIEGYVVLASELLAIREIVPYVGSGTDTVSIIIAAVLMPLAFGYYHGGHFRPYTRRGVNIGIRRKLILNIFVSMVILTIGLSYVFLNIFFFTLIDMGIKHRLLLTAIYAGLFFVTPVYLLGQTIPLISNYFTKEKLAKITGKILFISTMGSFLGAVFSTLVLMSTVGVHNTVSMNIILLAVLVILLSKKKKSENVLYVFCIAVFGIILNSNYVMSAFGIVSNNQYNTVMVFTDKDGNNHMSLNHMGSSMYNPQTERKHRYIEFLERQLIDPIRFDETKRDILIIGAGAFTFGFEDKNHNYDFADIDKTLKEISEEYILKQKLPENKKFIPIEARAFLGQTDKKYDIIILDVYQGDVTIPEHLITQEFFQKMKGHLKPNGNLAANFIVSANFGTPFSRHLDNTFRSVFPHVSRHVITENYALWQEDPNVNANVIYLYTYHPDENDKEVYTDNLNRIFFDKPQKKSNTSMLKTIQSLENRGR